MLDFFQNLDRRWIFLLMLLAVSIPLLSGTLFFSAHDGSTGEELWRSDGTMTGTVRVADIYSGSESSSPNKLTGVNDTLFFAADDGENGSELWKSDGSAEGTVLVRDINPTEFYGYAYGSSPAELTNVNGTLYFVADDLSMGMSFGKATGRRKAPCWSKTQTRKSRMVTVTVRAPRT